MIIAPSTVGVALIVAGAGFAAVAVFLAVRRRTAGSWPTDDARTAAERAADARTALDRAARLAEAGVEPDPATADERARLTAVFEVLASARDIAIPDRVRTSLDHLTPDELRDVIADTLGLARFEDSTQIDARDR
ncbi:hypothetical protein [Leifsonia sp. TF02-11]|uniref:hypothetical protein n=1 Tax=Leifsonia sp. TF02-11 TaxID=2815212 RepID=UPI001AA0BCE2|nr:hypothetical protein [Leifsonia sp. TF02-11]MBO1738608.1 hypothetical protein [Leifsonia sp. TF02-11]